MAINISRGLQRIYLVMSALWIFVFLYAAYDSLPKKIGEYTIVALKSCKVTENHWEDGLDTKLKSLKLPGNKTLENLTKGKFEDYILYSEVLKRKNMGLLTTDDKNKCALVMFNSLFERWSSQKNHLVIASLPIPLYFVLLFIVNGFYRKEKSN